MVGVTANNQLYMSIYIYMYVYMCLYVCMYVYTYTNGDAVCVQRPQRRECLPAINSPSRCVKNIFAISLYWSHFEASSLPPPALSACINPNLRYQAGEPVKPCSRTTAAAALRLLAGAAFFFFFFFFLSLFLSLRDIPQTGSLMPYNSW